MASVKDVATLYQNLKTEWAKKPRKLDKCGELLNKIKVRRMTCQISANSIIKNKNTKVYFIFL